MKFSTNKEKGNTALGIAIAFFTSQGYVVSIPLNDTQDYDLIVDNQETINRIQVKGTGCISKTGKYQVALKSCGGTKGITYKTIINTNIDYVFIVTGELKMYLIPKKDIKNVSTLSLCEKYKKYMVKI